MASTWILGFKRQSDEDGLTEVKIVNEYLATLPPKDASRAPKRFSCEKSYRKCTAKSSIAKEKTYRNLSSRNTVVFGAGWLPEAIEYKVTQGEPKTDFNSPPEAHAKAAQKWEQVGIFAETHPKGRAWSYDWNPAIDDKAILADVKKFVESLNAPTNPGVGFGPK